jgi:DNA-binding winged helix-turn-helix (wHTH) protein/TolB-like protein
LFDFDPASGALTRGGTPVRLQPQPARVLALLAERPGEIVTREELRQRIWGDETFVDFERGLNFCVAQIRSALGDSAASPRYIETLPRRGYRFIAPVSAPASAPPDVPTGPVVPFPVTPRWRSRWALSAVALALLFTFLAGAARTSRLWRGDVSPGPVRLAVVPFDNETGDPAFDAVARGVADATVARLATPELLERISVIGNAAVLQGPRDRRDLKAIGTALGVNYVVLGQVKRDRERVRVIAHLIRVSDQAHLWAKTFDRPSFTLAVQEDLAREIALSVAGRLARPA